MLVVVLVFDCSIIVLGVWMVGLGLLCDVLQQGQVFICMCVVCVDQVIDMVWFVDWVLQWLVIVVYGDCLLWIFNGSYCQVIVQLCSVMKGLLFNGMVVCFVLLDDLIIV